MKVKPMPDDEKTAVSMQFVTAPPEPSQPASQGTDASIEGALAKLVTDLQGIDSARNAVEQRGIQFHNQAQQLLIENEDRVAEVDRAINAEDELISKCQTAIDHLQAMVKEHGANLSMLKIEKQTRLNTIHNLKSNDVH